MSKRNGTPRLLGAALLLSLPFQGGLLAQGSGCGPFADVTSSDPFCPFILQAFFTGITNGTGTSTFSPNDFVPRNQMVTFFDRGVDLSIHRGSVRTAIGKTWFPTVTNGGVATDIGGGINDIVSDGTNLWIARVDGKVLKVSAADRRLLETWSLTQGVPMKLGVFAGLVYIADNQGSLHVLNPTNTAGAATLLFSKAISVTAPYASLAFDGTNVWMGNSSSRTLLISPVNSGSFVTYTLSTATDGMVFDGTNMWLLEANSNLYKLALSAGVLITVETIAIPGAVNDCRMVFDGNNIWIPIGNSGTLYVVRPTVSLAAFPSSIIINQSIPSVGFPYVADFDGENVMIGGVNNGTVALYKATNVSLIRTFNSGANSVRAIGSDGRTFNVGDNNGTKFFQF